MSQSQSDASPALKPNPWNLARRGCLYFMFALVLGTLATAPILPLRVQSYYERNYQFHGMPADDTALLDWGRAFPGVVSCQVTRQDHELTIRWDYRGLTPKPSPIELGNKLRELGYDMAGMRGGSSGLSSGLPELLTDPLVLTSMFVGLQLALGIFGIIGIRTSAKHVGTLPSLFAGRTGPALLTGLVGGGGLLIMGFVYSELLRLLLGYSPASPWDSASSMPPLTRISFLVFGGLGAPLAEEIFFRGYLFGTFQRAGFIRFGLLLSAALFASAHFSDLANLAAIFLYGIVLAWLFHRSRSLLAPITAHAVNNIVAISGMLLL